MRFHLIVASRYENKIKERKKHARIKKICIMKGKMRQLCVFVQQKKKKANNI